MTNIVEYTDRANSLVDAMSPDDLRYFALSSLLKAREVGLILMANWNHPDEDARALIRRIDRNVGDIHACANMLVLERAC